MFYVSYMLRIMKKLQKIGITGETVWEFLEDVFVHQDKSIKVARLFDCDSHQEFDDIFIVCFKFCME